MATTTPTTATPGENKRDDSGGRRGLARYAPYLFVAPFAALFAGFVMYPLAYSFGLSFAELRGGVFSFAGLGNYQSLFTDPLFYRSLLNTGVILAVQVPLMILLATVIASIIGSNALRYKALFRLAFFLPVAIDLVTYSIVFSLVFDDGGIVNGFLGLFGVGPLGWTSDPFWARILIVIALTWRWTGYNAIIILSGIQGIPRDVYEAAKVDGAGVVTTFFRITVPLLRPVLLFCIVLGTIGTMQLFTEPYILTGGGPNNATLTTFYYLYDTAFGSFDFGLAAAGTYVLTSIIALMSYIQFKALGGGND